MHTAEIIDDDPPPSRGVAFSSSFFLPLLASLPLP